jgi:hypothetical protein
MIKVHILAQCEHSKGGAPLPESEAESYICERIKRYLPHPKCQGSGNQAKCVSLAELATLLKEIQCPHEHTSLQGGFHFTAGDVWDDITEVCYVYRENQSAPELHQKKENPLFRRASSPHG